MTAVVTIGLLLNYKHYFITILNVCLAQCLALVLCTRTNLTLSRPSIND